MKALVAVLAVVAGTVLVPASAQAATARSWCFQVPAPYRAAPAAGSCGPGRVQVNVPAGGTQVLTVTNRKQSSSYAVFSGFSLRNGSWRHVWGPWTARIGAGGLARPGQKIEGDALTPQGSYRFQFMFGVDRNPGVRFSWRHAYRYDYWDDDPGSARYNLWTDTRHANAGRSAEPLHNVPSYSYAAVIGYNLARVRGAGSAIFLHVGDGQATAGCVSLPQAQLLRVIRWLTPASHPVIAMHPVR